MTLVSAARAAGLIFASAHALGAADAAPAAKPNSKFNGVQVGLNVPYSFGNQAMGPDEILEACVKLDLSGLELRAQPVEKFLGMPAELLSPRRAAAKGEAAATAVPVDPLAAQQRIEALSKWRAAVAMDQVQAFRRKYESAGVRIEILKVDGIFTLPDADLDYFFAMAKK